MTTKRSPTPAELEIGRALTKWLDQHNAEIVSKKELSRNRWITTWRTPFGCLIISTSYNRITGIAAQIPHNNVGNMLHVLDHWTGHGPKRDGTKTETNK